MKRANSFSSDILNINNNDRNKDKIFISMKETLHNPLQIIKSKQLINCFYINKSNKDNNNKISEINKENKNIFLNESNKEELDKNISIDINNGKKLDFSKEEFNTKNHGRNTFLEKYIIKEKEKNNSEMIDYNTSPNTNSDNNIEKIGINENNDLYSTDAIKDNKYSLNEKNAMNELKNLALKIKNKINTFEICGKYSELSMEDSKSNINNNEKNYNTSNNNNISKRLIPFEFINYSFLDISTHTRRSQNNTNNINNIESKIINIKKHVYKNEQKKSKSKDKKNNNKYINYIKNTPNIKIRKPSSDIYTREMEYKNKKELKLEQMRKKEIEEELSELQHKPKINHISKKMIKNKTPIYKRIKQIEFEKNNKIEKIKENINKNNTEYSFISNNKQKFNEEDFKKWLISNEKWNVKKNIKLNNIKKEIKDEEDLYNEEFNFHPKINKNSERLFKANYSLSSVPVNDRLCYGKGNKEEPCYKNKNEKKLTFIPKINKYYHIRDKYYEFMDIDQFQIYNKSLQKKHDI